MPDEEEHRRRDQRVGDRQQHGAVEPEVVEREDAERDEPHLRERRVGDDPAQVGGTEREQRAVDEPRAARARGRRTVKSSTGSGNLASTMTQEPVDRGLRDDRREHRRDLDRRLAVRERQPAVEREERRLHRERDRESEEDPGVVARPRVERG